MSPFLRGLFVIAGVVLLGCQPPMEPTVEPLVPRGQSDPNWEKRVTFPGAVMMWVGALALYWVTAAWTGA